MVAANLCFFLAMVVDAVLSPEGVNYEVQALIGVNASFKDPHGVLGNWDNSRIPMECWGTGIRTRWTLAAGILLLYPLLRSLKFLMLYLMTSFSSLLRLSSLLQ